MYCLIRKYKLPPQFHQYIRILNLTTVSTPEKKVKYTDTILLPQTRFPQYLNSKKVVERDEIIHKECGFSELYSWQRENLQGKEFVLHDGPPYANGKPHIGHAVNKIMKDITVRNNLIQGRRVHYVPGWDCHGLPIELKAITDGSVKLSTTEVRAKARKFAKSSSDVQKEAFRSWGVLGDWDRQVYYTYNTDYVINQLQMFWKLYEKGYLFRDLKPVYWSPSSKSALAESELIYKEDHVSKAITVAVDLVGDPFNRGRTQLLIWTTTPWTLPSNEAICYSKDLKYCLVSINSSYYVLAEESVAGLQKKIEDDVNIVDVFDGSRMMGLSYKHPWDLSKTCSLYPSGHVTSAGTGLVHTAPAHGQDDFLVGIANKLKLECRVDEEGKFTSSLPELHGMNCLTEGNKYVIDKLKDKILIQENYKHSYPYDWRTNKPIIIRASQQWFLDTELLKKKALEAISKITYTGDRLEALVSSRPYWCVSRQRLWGVPIPVLYHKLSGRPLITKQFIDHVCHMFETKGPDTWWTEPIETLLPKQLRQDMMINVENCVRSNDIMDIWLDSGLSWSHVLGGRVSDVCIEGTDQFTGWFQSSLLTSVALQDKAPYKKLVTHGFVVDEGGRKMSKSVGNVVDPETVVRGTKARGVDCLRWFVASHSHHPQIPMSDRLLATSFESVQKLRLIFRFLLGSLNNTTLQDYNKQLITCNLDLYYINELHNIYNKINTSYNNYQYNQVTVLLNNFFTNLSSVYLHVIKDRLYCDDVCCDRRRSSVATLSVVLETLVRCVAPVLPHLAEEVYKHHPVYDGGRKLFYTTDWDVCECWNVNAVDVVACALKIKHEVDKMSGAGGTHDLSVVIVVGGEEFVKLKNMQADEFSCDSELTELLQVSSVTLKTSQSNETQISLSKTELHRCPRCRRYTSAGVDVLCTRCTDVLAS